MYSFDQNGSTPSAYEAHSDGEVSNPFFFFGRLLYCLCAMQWKPKHNRLVLPVCQQRVCYCAETVYSRLFFGLQG